MKAYISRGWLKSLPSPQIHFIWQFPFFPYFKTIPMNRANYVCEALAKGMSANANTSIHSPFPLHWSP
jgi:hypothetical protein